MFLSDIFNQFLILLILLHFLFFLPSYLFRQILYHRLYPSDFFHRILCQYCLYFFANSISQFQDFYIISHSSLISFTCLVSFIRVLVNTRIHPISFIRFFLNMVHIFCELNFSSFKTSISPVTSYLSFYLSDLIHHSPCRHSYPSDLFHPIISQYSLYFPENSIFPVSRLLYLYSMFLPCFHQSDIYHQSPCHK